MSLASGALRLAGDASAHSTRAALVAAPKRLKRLVGFRERTRQPGGRIVLAAVETPTLSTAATSAP